MQNIEKYVRKRKSWKQSIKILIHKSDNIDEPTYQFTSNPINNIRKLISTQLT